jgi:hypothetical protein
MSNRAQGTSRATPHARFIWAQTSIYAPARFRLYSTLPAR